MDDGHGARAAVRQIFVPLTLGSARIALSSPAPETEAAKGVISPAPFGIDHPGGTLGHLSPPVDKLRNAA